MHLQFWGATKEVTGSKHLLSVGASRYLLDCGAFQGHKNKGLEHKNRDFLVPPKDIKDIILSHAHIDHSGLLPYFVVNGFKGNIYSTPATYDLCGHLLLDSAHIQEMDHSYSNRHDLEEKEFERPLYSTNDIPPTMEKFVSINYNRDFTIDNNLSLKFYDAGHVLGSSLVELTMSENNISKKLLFTGDLGRKGLPILRDPTYVEQADYVIIEGTYGNKIHDPVANMEKDVANAVNDAHQRGGKIIIPAFSLERTQEIIYILHLLVEAGKIPEIPIFVDSPLSFNITQVFQMHPEAYDIETYQAFLMHQANPFGFAKLRYVKSTEESKSLNNYKGPCIIISASGMCEAGRIRHHIANNVQDANNMVLIIGYQAEGTLGRRLVEGEKKVRLFGIDVAVNAEIRVLNSFSAHADKNDIIDWLSHMKGIQKVFLVHGEEKPLQDLKETISSLLQIPEVIIPTAGEVFEL